MMPQRFSRHRADDYADDAEAAADIVCYFRHDAAVAVTPRC